MSEPLHTTGEERQTIELPGVRLLKYYVEGGEALLEGAEEGEQWATTADPSANMSTEPGATTTGAHASPTLMVATSSNSHQSETKAASRWQEKESLALLEMWSHSDFRKWKTKHRAAMFNAWRDDHGCTSARGWSAMEQHFNGQLKKGNAELARRLQTQRTSAPIDWDHYSRKVSEQ
ncbi:hypothetical protein B0A50_00200 [Salinomyces thailandicus]|uniref:Uncharacterized protein n=1 Tax=Salinomyces thailandicus TaxID=706561 RepID=A0A4U0UF87_9PEZI|nr:hypothetical protein B0A50_00200 [Salinomyces thailandica]